MNYLEIFFELMISAICSKHKMILISFLNNLNDLRTLSINKMSEVQRQFLRMIDFKLSLSSQPISVIDK